MSSEHEILKPETAKGELSDEMKEAFDHYVRLCMPIAMICSYWILLPDMLARFADSKKTTHESAGQV